ncbi:transposase [Streptosporangiaceae bacterium NEAU-GS5]|nr:transposase [Streptosporangiaceae bacterium NEAU-GS5]
MLSYRAAIPLSNRTLARLTELIRGQRADRGTRWRRLDPARQALLVLAHLRNGDTYARLAGGFAIGTTTAWRYVRESIDLLAQLADDLHAAIARASRLAYAIVDGTLIPIDRLADQRPYFSGKHHRHGVNVQVLADPAGRLVWASPALPGSTHDLTAARAAGLIDGLTSANVMVFADKGYQGAGGTIRTPFKRHRHRPRLSRRQKEVNRAHARLRAVGERAVATLKAWKILAKVRCCPHRVTAIVQAITVLHGIETARYSGCRVGSWRVGVSWR